MTPERFEKLKRVLSQRQPTLTVLMEEVNKPHNFSAILRSCDAVGVWEAHAVPPKNGKLPTYNATSGSAEKWVRVQSHADAPSAVRELQGRGFQVLATHLSARSVDYRELDYTRPTCVLLGAEKWGVSEEAADAADANVVIPMLGMVQSLNVSVACATILFEAQRQRLAAGLYGQAPFPPDEFDRVLFEWAYPDLADTYRERGEPYPALDEHGEIIRA
ncbi:tRNA (guanosine(18)-2'-O)-methyltransferase TrmH [Deinococcus maricopensis]|uniref:tRNA (guanosine(18)-2'-O)-methyltransferase n=1 Tax=Deinococcus maricopensis (strain DSM 21211 / LMG 22137 / NRRL B-23946 / LB-34) TaxID=709986 RepID=E8U2Y2_DEIML|nr:tRNA (guanosine(18)-2'-O)-methyltransferase TrmH [Deinococcus maricopensis]ADV65720.1 tRNA guanosine-2'-O-methyltransferase [Deinococcus maricopensis DSM 21211]